MSQFSRASPHFPGLVPISGGLSPEVIVIGSDFAHRYVKACRWRFINDAISLNVREPV